MDKQIVWNNRKIVVTDTEFDTEWVNVLSAFDFDTGDVLTENEIEIFNDDMQSAINHAFAEEYMREFYIALK